MVAFSGLTAKIVDRTKNMADVYNAFAHFAAQITEKVQGLSFLNPGLRATGAVHLNECVKWWVGEQMDDVLPWLVVIPSLLLAVPGFGRGLFRSRTGTPQRTWPGNGQQPSRPSACTS